MVRSNIPTSFIFFALLLFSTSIVAQNLEERKTIGFDTPQLIFKWNLLSLTEIEPTFQLGVEYIFKPKIGFQQQLGYIFANPSSDIWGIRSRSEMKFYLNKSKRRGRPFYVGTEVLYKFARNFGTETFSREGGAYTQVIDFHTDRNVIGFTPKLGFMNNFENQRFVFDMAFGIGVKATYYNSNLPGDADLPDTDFVIWDFSNLGKSGHDVFPNILLSLQIGFKK